MHYHPCKLVDSSLIPMTEKEYYAYEPDVYFLPAKAVIN
jgi:hypothetical protein